MAPSARTIAPTRRRRALRFISSTRCSALSVFRSAMGRRATGSRCRGRECGRHGQERSENDDSISFARLAARRGERRVDVVEHPDGGRARRPPASSRARIASAAAPRGPGSVATNHRSIRALTASITPRTSLSASMPNTAIVAGKIAHRAQRRREHARRVRIVRDVEHDRGLAREAPGIALAGAPCRGRRARRRRERAAGPAGVRRRERRGGVRELIGAAQRGIRAARSDRRRGPSIATAGRRRHSRSRVRSASPARRSRARGPSAWTADRAPRTPPAARRGRCRPSRARCRRASGRGSPCDRDRSSSPRPRRQSTTFTASSRPPSPTSRIATSSPARANAWNAASVPYSK